MQKLRLVFFLMFGILASSHAQTNSAVLSLVDTPPINGQGDSAESGFMVGELVNAPLSGLFRSELLVPLPTMPTNSQLTSAVLSLNFTGSSGTNGNSTFGPLSVYYSSSHNTLTFNTTDYSSADFVLVTNSFLTPDSPPAIYNLDVTRQVATNYSINGASQFLAGCNTKEGIIIMVLVILCRTIRFHSARCFILLNSPCNLANCPPLQFPVY